MAPDALLEKPRSQVERWLAWSNGLGLYHQWRAEEEEARMRRDLDRIGGS